VSYNNSGRVSEGKSPEENNNNKQKTKTMDWSTKAMLQETLRCLQKTEADLSVDLRAVKAHVQHAVRPPAQARESSCAERRLVTFNP
jgi:hypothetical protein